MKTYSIIINKTGLDRIATALREHHKQGGDVTGDMISAYASDAENGYAHGHDVTFEIAASESLTGHPVVINVGRDWYDLHEYDEFEDEDRVVEWPTKYYVIKVAYVGPNEDQHVDADRVEIRTTPARTNSSHEICLEGWCGTDNDWAVFAHGAYATQDEAEAYIHDTFGEVRAAGEDEFPFGWDDDVVAMFRFGKYIPMDAEGTGNYCWEVIQDVTANTPDWQIDQWIDEIESHVNDEGYTLDKSSLEDSMYSRRDELLEEIKAGIEIEDMEWSPELVGFICTLEDGRVVQVQFEKNTNVLDAGCGDYYPVLDTQNEYGLDLSDIEREVFMELIRDDETVQEKAKEL